MPNIKSAIKRVSVIKRRQDENKVIKSKIATEVKKFRNAVANKEENLDAKLSKLFAEIDSSVSKGIIKKETANRKKSRLSSLLNKKEN